MDLQELRAIAAQIGASHEDCRQLAKELKSKALSQTGSSPEPHPQTYQGQSQGR